jgi:hypothetical protein
LNHYTELLNRQIRARIPPLTVDMLLHNYAPLVPGPDAELELTFVRRVVEDYIEHVTRNHARGPPTRGSRLLDWFCSWYQNAAPSRDARRYTPPWRPVRAHLDDEVALAHPMAAWRAHWSEMSQLASERRYEVRATRRALLHREHAPEDTRTQDGAQTCIVCFDRPRSVIYTGCRHFDVCEACYEKHATCPTCRHASPAMHIDEYLNQHAPFMSGGCDGLDHCWFLGCDALL